MEFILGKTTGQKATGKFAKTGLILWAALLALSLINAGCIGVTGANSNNGAPDTTAPSVSITSPAAGASVSGTVNVVAIASDDVAVVGVQFKVDGANAGAEDVVPPFAIAWNTSGLSNGNHTLTVVARDAAGNAATSAPVVVSVGSGSTDSTAPSISITSPAAGASVTGTITVQVNASDNVGVVGVQFKVDGANTGTEDTVAPFSYSLNTSSLSNGSHSLTAVARDAAGNTTTSTAVSVNVNNPAPDTTAPSASISAPAGGSTVSGSVTLSANASDNVGVVGVQFKVDGANVGAEDTTAPYSVSWNTSGVSNSSHTITAVARDAAGNSTTSAAATITVNNVVTPPDTTPPTVSLTAPANGQTVSGAVTISANASDNVGVAGVQFKVDGVNQGAEDTTAPYSVSVNTALLSNGSHTFSALARDAAGNSNTATISASVSNQSSGSCGSSVTDATRVIPPPSMPPHPALLQQFTDASFGACVTRITDVAQHGDDGVHDYSELQAWNANMSRILLQNGRIIDATTSAVVRDIDLGYPEGGNGIRWSPTDPDVLYYLGLKVGSQATWMTGCADNAARLMKYILPAGTRELVACFPEYTKFDKNRSFQSMSIDGKYIALVGVTPGGAYEAFLYDVIAKQKLAIVPVDGTIEWVEVSPLGDYLLVNWANGGEGPRTGVQTHNPQTGARIGQLSTGRGHGSTALAPDGSQWYVFDAFSTSFTPGGNQPQIVKARIPKGYDDWKAGDPNGMVSLLIENWDVGQHISCKTPRSEWCAVGTYAMSTPNVAYFHEVFRLSLNSTIAIPKVQRLVHHYSDFFFVRDNCTMSEYWVQPHASTSPDGSKIIFGSSWGQVCRAEAYIIRLTGSSPPPPQADTTPPTVSLTAPSNGQTVSGAVTISADASDNVGVARVQFKVDGVNQGAEDTSTPYSVSWNTAGVSNGSHSITAVAHDAAGNTSTSPAATITVNNPPPPTDTTPPVISGLLATPNTTSAVISWATNEAADSQVEYGPTTAYGSSSPLGSTLVTGHSVTLTGLTSNTTYNFRVKSRDAAGNLAVSGNQTFTTLLQSGGGIPSTLGWYEIPSTRLSSACPPNQFGYDFQFYCASQGAVTGAWNGGIADTKRNRLIIWGGGHGDYAGNEVYALDLNALQMKRLNDPSPPALAGTSDRTSDGKANSRHTYNGLAYIEYSDKMFVFGGSLWRGGQTWSDTWLLDLTTLQWEFVSGASAGPTDRYNSHAHYDPVTKKVLLADRSSLWWFDPQTKQYARIGSFSIDLATSSVLDPKRHVLFAFGMTWGGSPEFAAINVDTGQAVNMSLSGCSGLMSAAAPGNNEGSGPGLAYDPVQDRIIGWVTGNTVFTFNPDTSSCTSQTFSGGPGAPESQGTYGRFRYLPGLGVFALVNNSNQNAYTLRLTPPQSNAQAEDVTISGLAVVNITATSATFTWTTTPWADGQVSCGVFAPDGIRSTLDLTPAIYYAHTLNFLDADTTYQCQVRSRSASGHLTLSPMFTFKTAAAGSIR